MSGTVVCPLTLNLESILIVNNVNHNIKGNEFSLLIGAPNSDKGGSIHFATVDRYDSTKTYLVKVSISLFIYFTYFYNPSIKIDCNDGKGFGGCLEQKMNPVLETENHSLGSVLKVVNNDLWVCDNRMQSKAQCRESYFE